MIKIWVKRKCGWPLSEDGQGQGELTQCPPDVAGIQLPPALVANVAYGRGWMRLVVHHVGYPGLEGNISPHPSAPKPLVHEKVSLFILFQGVPAYHRSHQCCLKSNSLCESWSHEGMWGTTGTQWKAALLPPDLQRSLWVSFRGQNANSCFPLSLLKRMNRSELLSRAGPTTGQSKATASGGRCWGGSSPLALPPCSSGHFPLLEERAVLDQMTFLSWKLRNPLMVTPSNSFYALYCGNRGTKASISKSC